MAQAERQLGQAAPVPRGIELEAHVVGRDGLTPRGDVLELLRGITSWRLTDKRYQHDATKGCLLPEKSLMTMTDGTGKTVPVPPAQLADLPACGAFEVNFAPSTFVMPRNVVSEGRAGLQDRGPLHLLVGPGSTS